MAASDVQARRTWRVVARAVTWVLWGAALAMVPAVSSWVSETARVPVGWAALAPGLWFYVSQQASAATFSLVAMALAHAVRGRLQTRVRALGIAAVATSVAYLALCVSGDVLLRGPLVSVPNLLLMVSRFTRLLKWVVWSLWGMQLSLWVLPGRDATASAPSSPIDGLAGADGLTAREREVAELLVSGSTQAQAAEVPGISASSVSTYRSRACEKLGLVSLDELVEPAPGAAAPPRPIGVGTPGSVPLMGIALTGSLTLRLLLGSSYYGVGAVLATAVLLGVPWLVLFSYAAWRGMRVRARELTRDLVLVMAALAAFGLLVQTGNDLAVTLGRTMVGVGFPAAVAHAAFLVAFAPHLLWPRVREERSLDEERCVLYLRGRGAGELQARVLTEIALGRSTPEVCENLNVARGTVNAYRAQGYELLGVHSSRELADLLARDVGYVPSAGKKIPSAENGKTTE